jgi:hypothetical protein
MTEHDYRERTCAHVDFTRWQLDCSLLWKSLNDEDVFDYPAYPWREWYERGLSVAGAIAQANLRLFGTERGA